jgi:peptidyl-prolyl cis-trans isomerase SurA
MRFTLKHASLERLQSLEVFMRKFSFLFIFLLSFSSFAAKELVDKILVVVNNETVLLSDLKKLQQRIQKPGAVDDTLLLGEKPETLKGDRKAQIDFLIREKLVESEIKRLNFSVTDDRVESEMNTLAKRAQMSRADFNKYIARQGFTEAEYKSILKTRLERQSFFESEIVSKLRITDEDAFGEFQSKNPNYRPNVNEFSIAQIFFSPKKGGAQAALDRANAISNRLHAGENFETLANQNNETPGANKDGVVGTFRSGEFLPEIERAVGSLSANEVSGVIKSPAGYHIVKVLSKKTTMDPNFLKVKEMIKASLVEKNFQRQLKNWFEVKKQDAYIYNQASTN